METETQFMKLQYELSNNPVWVDVIHMALEFEREDEEKHKAEPNYKVFGWEWHDVHTNPRILNQMVTSKLVDITYSSRSSTHYKLHDPVVLQAALNELTELKEKTGSVHNINFSELFKTIVKHDNIKRIVGYALTSAKPVHLLLEGAPASSKTLFLMELNTLPDSYYCLAQTLSRAGLLEVLFVNRPKYLLVDEIDRLREEDLGVLNSLMTTGVVAETKYGKTRSLMLQTWVFAAGITASYKLPKDLLSRFSLLRFPVYNREDFMAVCQQVLASEGITEDSCTLIARECWKLYGENSDVRKAVQIARLSQGILSV